jgi:hypothetical protein
MQLQLRLPGVKKTNGRQYAFLYLDGLEVVEDITVALLVTYVASDHTRYVAS